MLKNEILIIELRLVDFGVYFKGLYMLFLLLPNKIKYTEFDMGQIGDGPVKKPFYEFVKGLDLWVDFLIKPS